MFAVIMSTGVVILYSGTDPSSADHWALVGIFKIGRPVGNRPLLKFGGDLIVITEDGFVPLLSAISNEQFRKQLAISDKISNLVNHDTRIYGENIGWQSIFYSKASWLLFNVPSNKTGRAHQYVMNSATGAWCKFTNMNAFCWETHGGKLYFGGKDGKVFRADNGSIDAITDEPKGLIKFSLQTAYNYLRSADDKKFTLCRPNISSLGDTGARLSIVTDQQRRARSTGLPTSNAVGAEWDEAEWDIAEWASEGQAINQWQCVNSSGASVSLVVNGSTNANEFKFLSADIMYEKASGI